jgi:hypothetical protein
MARIVSLLLVFSFLLPGSAFSNAVPAGKDPACALLFKTETQIDIAIAEVLTELKTTRDAYESAIIHKYGEKIAVAVTKACAKPQGCTRVDVLKAATDEADRLIGKRKLTKKLLGYAKLTTVMVSLIVVSGMSTKFIDSDVIKILIGAQIGILLNHIRAPIDALYETVLRKKAFQQISPAVDQTRPENLGFKRSFNTMQATYTGLERDGRGVILGAQNDMTNHVIKLQNYFILSMNPAAEVKVSDDDLARMLAALFYEARVFHADIPPTNPQMQSIFAPTVQPLAPLFTRLEKKVWGALDELELREAKTSGRSDYNRKAAQKFYDELTYEWFKRDQMPVKSLYRLGG